MPTSRSGNRKRRGSPRKGRNDLSIEKLRKGCALVVAVYLVLAAVFFWIGGEQLRFQDTETTAVSAAQSVGELTRGMELRQPFFAPEGKLTGISMRFSTYDRVNTCHVQVDIEDETGTVLAQAAVDGADLADNAVRVLPLAQPAALRTGERYYLVVRSPDGTPGNGVTVWTGNAMEAGRGQVALDIPDQERLLVNGVTQEGMLSYTLLSRTELWFGRYYWPLAAGAGALLVGCCLWLLHTAKRGKHTAALRVLEAFRKYSYLMKQLIARDFKTKYKRSVLGVLWSFLNPLLTMLVQYIVFSTLFRSDIDNFPLYLLTGIVCFNFFNEACGMGLQSITGNASLITKVYVPKYIYPVSRVLSSMVNLLLSLIPLLLVMLVTRTPLRPAVLLLPFGIACLVAFSIGMSFILSTAMVFFRDTQFLWGVVSMLWMYATPIFYPESIIPGQFMALYKCNPLYHIIRFIRIILIQGVSPEPKAYGLCLLASFVPLLVGAVVFKRNQDKFVLNL